MTVETRVTALAQAAGTDVKAILALTGALANLNTTAKTNLVDAINEIVTAANAASGIDDGVTAAGSTWSSNKISQELADLLTGLVGTAPGVLDTIQELSAAFANNPDTIANLQALVTANSDAIAALATNVGDTNTDYVAIYNAAKA